MGVFDRRSPVGVLWELRGQATIDWDMRVVRCPVLVIGAGGAGLRAALAASRTLADPRGVLIATKGELGKSGTTALACSDRMAFHATLPHTEPGGPYNWIHHAEDIYRIGGCVSDADLAAILARCSADAFGFLDSLGVPFARGKDGRVHQFVTDGSEFARACYTGPYTANHIEAALLSKIREEGIPVLEGATAVDILTDPQDGAVSGALLLISPQQADRSAPLPEGPGQGLKAASRGVRQELLEVRAGAVVLATGGAGEIYRHHVFPPGQTGDGCAMALRCGAELTNIEFVQIGLCSVATGLACSGSLMRAIPRFVDGSGKDVLDAFLPIRLPAARLHELVFRKGSTWPVSAEKETHLIDLAVERAILDGKQVFLDYSRNPESFDFDALPVSVKERYFSEVKAPAGESSRCASPLARVCEINPDVVRWFAERGILLERGDGIEVVPAAQHFQGGVKIGTSGETRVKGLFAAGETAGGQHGANRPGGNSLLDGQVFGQIAGESAALWAIGDGSLAWGSVGWDPSRQGHDSRYFQVPGAAEVLNEVSPAAAVLERGAAGAVTPSRGLPSGEVRRELKSVVSGALGVARTPERLRAALAHLEELQARGHVTDMSGVAFFVETENMLLIARAMLEAAMMRMESRGPHLMFEGEGTYPPLPRDDDNWQRYVVIRGTGCDMELEARVPVSWEEAFSR